MAEKVIRGEATIQDLSLHPTISVLPVAETGGPAPVVISEHVDANIESKSEVSDEQAVLGTSESCEEDGDASWDLHKDNPLNWSSARKWTLITLLALINFVAAIAGTAFEPALPVLMSDFDSNQSSLASFTISVYVLGYCLGPLVVAPLSELYGRSAVLYPALLLFCVTLGGCSASTDIATFITLRAFMGLAGISFLLMGSAVVADMIRKERRGLALSIIMSGPSIGPTIGPIIGGFVIESTTWRWIFWSLLIAAFALSILSLLIYRETYAMVLKPRILKPSTHTIELKRKQTLHLAWTRPLRLLLHSPLIWLLALSTSIANSFLQLAVATLGTVFQNAYAFSPAQSGLAYLGLTVGFILSQLTLGFVCDWYMLRRRTRRQTLSGDDSTYPEDRLPPMLVGSALLPVGFLIYGWALEFPERVPWIVPVVGSGVVAVGVMYTYMSPQIYVIDAFTEIAASAAGASTIVRSAVTALVPLAGNPLYERLGYGRGNSLLAGIALVNIPLTLVLMVWGGRIRTSERLKPVL